MAKDERDGAGLLGADPEMWVSREKGEDLAHR